MRSSRIVLAALALAIGAPCAAVPTVGLVTSNANGNGSGSGGGVCQLSNSDTTVGDVLVVVEGVNGPAASTVSDVAGNTFISLNAFGGAGSNGKTSFERAWYFRITNAATAPTNIVLNSSDTDYCRSALLKITGLTGGVTDVNGSGVSAVATSISITSPALASATEVVIGVADEVAQNDSWSATEPTGFTRAGEIVYGGHLLVDYQVTTTSTAKIFNPNTATHSDNKMANIYSFYVPPIPPCSTRMMLTGVGC